MSGWTIVDKNSNKSLPMTGTNNSAYVTPATEMQDPVGKMRMSEPQSLIDTDFEYGTQPTKWETLSTQQNRSSVYYLAQQPRTVTSIAATVAGQRTIRVLMANTTGFSVGTPIYVQNSLNANYNGWFLVSAVSAGVSVDYVATADPTLFNTSNVYAPSQTYVYLGYFYSNSGINLVGTTSFTTDGTTTITVNTGFNHGLSAGSLIYVVGTTSSGTSVNGAQVVTAVLNNRRITFTNTNGAVAASAITNTSGYVNLYARPAGYVESRAFDGGVAFSEGAAVPNTVLTRQTRRYFRYQSGKGIQFSTGSVLKPLLQARIYVIDQASTNQEGQIQTRTPHGLVVGSVIQITGSNFGYANGTFTVTTIFSPDYFAFSIPNLTVGLSVTVSGAPTVSVTNWYGSSNRLGMFDQQNGMFFEYDGQTLYAVWRSSTTQLLGVGSATNGGNVVSIASGGQLTNQLTTGDFIVIRGQSYRVIGVASNTSLVISPEYRGPSMTNCVISKTVDVKVPQSQWSDKLDGTGPSGYVLDLTKMQMWYIDYSWYGAGFIRWGLRTTKGQVTYVYQQTNNNLRNEAFLRSGNMCARYETNGLVPITQLTQTLPSVATTGSIINVVDASLFAPSGVVRVYSGASGGSTQEYISYVKESNTRLRIVARNQPGGNTLTPTLFSYSASGPMIAVEYASPDTAAAISHWGSSVIMDGRFDDDKSLIFNYGTTTAITTTSTSPIVILAIRVAPSVDNGTTGLLGEKEIINRMQLELDSLGFYTTGTGYLVNLVLNGFASGAMSGGFIAPIQQAGGLTSSLAQVATNTNAVTVTGGESVFAGYTNTSGNSTFDLSGVRDLGNSIQGGGTSNTVPTSQSNFYPDGPDILYVVATPLSSTSSTIQARLSWKEAQA
jgi:hypothetical protein